jgi:hypothetical protein
LPDGWVSGARELGLVADGLGMNWLNEHSLRFLFPADRYGTDQRVMETSWSQDSSRTAGLNFRPKLLHPPTYQSLGAWMTVGAGIKEDPHAIANSVTGEG